MRDNFSTAHCLLPTANLLNSIPDVQVSDTTLLNSSTTAGLIIKWYATKMLMNRKGS